MNKKVLAAAIAAAMVAPVAQADLKISGRVAMELVSEDGNINAADYGNQRLQFDFSDESGFMGRMALDMRQSKFTGYDPTLTAPSATAAYRDYYVGYKGSFGGLMAGRLAGAGKNIEGDKYVGTFLELRNAFVKGGKYGSSSFIDNMIEYNNKFGDSVVKLQYNPTDNGGAKGDLGASIKAKLAGAGVFAAYNNQGDTNTYWKVGGNMKFGEFNTRLVYENDDGQAEAASWVLGADMGFGNGWTGTVDYSDKGELRTESAYRVGVYKKFSKKAHMWAGYTQNGTSSTTTAAFAAYGVGFRVDI